MKFPLLPILFLFSACSSTIVKEKLNGGSFPEVTATRLSGESIFLPKDLNGKHSVLLIGYRQKAQFDIDRWLLGLLDGKVNANILEVPTISGMIPGALSELIDSGMRSGIPQEDWYSVATVYDDADKIISVLGNENPNLAHVVILNPDGKIIWHYYQGYSPKNLLMLKEKLNS
jgi:hypothetical protein